MNSPLASGTKLGRYEIRSLLGVGGMGEVYRARDDKLNRDVAIKVLPATFSQDATRLRRFEQEAQATGTLNHPNILAVFDVGIENGAPYVVSELLEGRTLRECLQDGPLPQRVAVDYAIQIARGLQVAHEKAIVHRDLKPENIFITQDSRVKILDFGLAKLVERLDGNIGQTEIETRRAQTAPGTVMGTVGYMSPEQVRGDHIDHRSDVFSFGAVLYEMLTGERAFRGDTAVETLNAILKEDPPQLVSPKTSLSSGLDRVVWHCLEKNRERRFQSAIDVAFALESLSNVSASVRTEITGSSESSRRQSHGHLLWIAVASVLLLTTLLVLIGAYRHEPAAEIRLMKFSVMPPPNSSFGHIALSPDGRWLAFAAATGAKIQLWVRPLDSVDARALPETEGASYPFWSPDGRFIGFFAAGKLKKTGLSDGITATICDMGVGTGGTWNRDGVILFSSLGGGGLFTVAATGGPVSSVKKMDRTRQESDYADPWFLPDGRHFLYSRFGGRATSRGIYISSLDNDLDKRLLDLDSNAEYAGPATNTGYLLFGSEEALMAQPFDLTRYQLTGEPAPVAARVGSILTSAVSSRRRNFSVSDNGTLIFDPFPNRLRNQLVWMDRAGKKAEPVSGLDNVSQARISPDDKRIVVTRLQQGGVTGNSDLWLADLSGGNATRFTFDEANDHFPIWSPDGLHIVWSSNRDGLYQLYEQPASGTGEATLLLKSEAYKFATDWSRDGRYLIFRQVDPVTIKYDVWVLPMFGDRKPFPFLQTEANEAVATLSPDGRWMAYCSDESGRYDIYVQSFPAGGGKRQISTGGGIAPTWRADGKELFYYGTDGKLMVVSVNPAATFEAGTPAPLFEFRASGNLITPYYSVTHDGQHFLLATTQESEFAAPLTVVLNWMTERKK